MDYIVCEQRAVDAKGAKMIHDVYIVNKPARTTKLIGLQFIISGCCGSDFDTRCYQTPETN